MVDDREGDIYPKWATEHAREGSVPQDNFHLLTRAMVDRRLANPEAGGATLFASAAAFPVAGSRKIDPRLRKGRPAGASARSRQAYSHGGNTVWRGGNLPPAR